MMGNKKSSQNYRTSRDYERLIRDLLAQNFTGVEGIDLLEISHNAKMIGASGFAHRVDVCYRFKIWQIEMLVIVECKQYKNAVGVDEPLEFKSRIDDLKAQKGIFVTSSGFQEGAVTFAKANRIALVIARGAKECWTIMAHRIAYPLEAYHRLVAMIEKEFAAPGRSIADRIAIDGHAACVTVSHKGAALRLNPCELEHYRDSWISFPLDDEEPEFMFLECEHFAALRTNMLLKAIVLEELLTTEIAEKNSGKPISG